MAIQQFRGCGSRRGTARTFVLSFLTVVVSSVMAFAAGEGRLEEKYVREMPSASRVLSDIQGKDPLDTSARQLGALYRLLRMMSLMSGEGPLSSQEKAVWDSYNAAMGPIYQSTIDGFDPNEGKWLFWRRGKNSSRANWHYQKTAYELDGNLEMELLKRYFSAEWQNKYLELRGLERSRIEIWEAQNAKEREMSPMRRRGPDPLLIGVVLFAYSAVLMAAFIFSLRGRVGLESSDPRKLLAGSRRYDLHSATGTVLSPTKDREVHTHVSGGGGYGQISGGTGYVHTAPITSRTTTITHVQFFLKKPDGKEMDIQLTDVDLALREGHALSVVWGIREGRDAGNHFLFRNHSTQRADFVDDLLARMLRPRIWPVVLLSLPLACLPSIPFFLARSWIVRNRLRRVKQQISERLIPQLDKG